MVFSGVAELNKRREAHILLVPFWKGKRGPQAAASLGDVATAVKPPLLAKDFSGNEGETSLVYFKGTKESRLLLVGLGEEEKLSAESLRRTYAKSAAVCRKLGATKLNLLLPTIAQLRHVTVDECLEGIAEGILLPNYIWSQKTDKEAAPLIRAVTLVGILPKRLGPAKEVEKVAEAVYFARDLINGNADDVTPSYLAKTARKLSESFPGVKTTIFDKKRVEKEGMGLLLAVGRGSVHDPEFIICKYTGAPRSKDHTVVIGKGVCYDTGGLNLKPTGSMETMRDDMSGAAAALGTVASVAALGLPVNVTAVVAATENAIGSNSYKPGDVYKSHLGKTVEIGNTDAEGRLTLADALSYTVAHLAPTRIVDFATLTGSMVIALGEGMSGVFSNNETLAKELLAASDASQELLWQMPLHAPYKKLLDSDIADLKNIGGRAGGSITAALFLHEFVGKTPWAHIDIAGTAFMTKESGYWPKGGVGFGVRLMTAFCKKIAKR